MPAMLDDPTAPTIYRASGSAPFPDPQDVHPALPINIYPRQVTLRDRVTTATIIPFSSRHPVPPSLLVYLCEQLNKEIEMGDTYPMIEGMTVEKFSSYWFQNFGAVMLMGNYENVCEIVDGKNWATACLGSYYIKPNYPGRSSHICNAGFLVTDAARNKGVGRLMGESYLDWAPHLGFNYSVFNLVYETNVASCRIWDALGFKRIGRVKGAGNLKSYPGQLVDAIIYGRDLSSEGEDFVSEERFEKIKFYLKYGKYPAGADRAEKSRLRSAATHYKLIPDSDKLMLKDKEVISDPQSQYEIAKNVHLLQHGGINKTTATIAERYHWVRIKETVSLVIRNCAQCKELGKAPVVRADGVIRPGQRPKSSTSTHPGTGVTEQRVVSAAGRVLSLPHPNTDSHGFQGEAGHGSVSPQVLNRTLPQSQSSPAHIQSSQLQQEAPIARMQNDYMPLDPQIMEDVRHHLGGYNTSPHHDFNADAEGHDSDSFQAMLSGTRHGNGGSGTGDGNDDLDMLINQDEDGEGDVDEAIIHGDGAIIQSQAEAAATAAEAALRTVKKEYGRD